VAEHPPSVGQVFAAGTGAFPAWFTAQPGAGDPSVGVGHGNHLATDRVLAFAANGRESAKSLVMEWA
jgi:hypothetical protein